jgi:hypothetical protein
METRMKRKCKKCGDPIIDLDLGQTVDLFHEYCEGLFDKQVQLCDNCVVKVLEQLKADVI